jgi:hypothetical protein
MNFQEFQKQLQRLEFTELVDLYLEAKTGKYTTAQDLLPMEIVDLINDLDLALKEAIEKEATE